MVVPYIVRRSFFPIVSLVLLGISAFPAIGQENPNASIKGDTKRLRGMAADSGLHRCSNSQCITHIRPLQFSVSIPGQGGMRVEFDRLVSGSGIKRFVNGQALADDSRPSLFLRGKVFIRHAGANGEAESFPASATLFMKSKQPKLQITVPKRARIKNKMGIARLASIIAELKDGFDRLSAQAYYVPLHALNDFSCALHSDASVSAIAPIGRSEGDATISASRVLNVAADSDYEWYSRYSSAYSDQVASIINSAATIYENQLSVSLNLTKVNVFTSSSQPYTLTESGSLLSQFRTYSNQRSQLGNADIYALFSEKNFDSSVIGIAYLAQACVDRTYSYAAIQDTTSTINPITVAHEFGHLLSAEHYDGSKSIMNTALGAPYPSSFDSGNKAAIASHLSANYSGCYQQALPTATPRTGPTSVPTAVPTSSNPTATPEPGTTPVETPTVAPTATTPPNGGGVNPNEPGASGVGLATTITSSGKFKALAAVASPQDDCVIYLRAAATAAKAYNGTFVAHATVSTTDTKSFEATLPSSVLPEGTGRSKNGRIYFAALYSCSGSGLSGYSGVRSVDASKIKAKRKLTKKKWIEALKGGLGG